MLSVLIFASQRSWCDTATAPIFLTLTSEHSVGVPAVDTIEFAWYPTSSNLLEVNGLKPAVIVVPGLGDTEHSPSEQRAALYFNSRGIDCAIITLPYHGHRLIYGHKAQEYFLSNDGTVVSHAMFQSASDVKTVMHWIDTQPGVDTNRTGVYGWSLGAIIVHLAMGLYPELKVGVAVGGGGDLTDIESNSLIVFPKRFFHPFHTTTQQAADLALVDPITYAKSNNPRHVLMIEGARDSVMQPHNAIDLWNALGRPPIEWMDMGHVGLGLAEHSEFAAGYTYFVSNWAAPGTTDPPLPQASGQTLKLGFVLLSASHPVIALQDQLIGIGHKSDHTAIIGMNVGVSTSRPFAAIGYTVTPYIDAGFAMRVSDKTAVPYVAWYFPF